MTADAERASQAIACKRTRVSVSELKREARMLDMRLKCEEVNLRTLRASAVEIVERELVPYSKHIEKPPISPLVVARRAAKRLAQDSRREAKLQGLSVILKDALGHNPSAKLIARPWLAPDLTAVQRRNIRRLHDPEFDVRIRIEGQLRRADPRCKARKMGCRLRNAVVSRKASQTLALRLGYTTSDLRQHLERLFTDGMCWDAFNRGQIHIDHCRPLRLFDCTTDEGIRAAWSLSNLQPLWAAENQTKAGRLLTLV